MLLRQQIGKEDWWFAWGLSAVMIGGLTLFGVVGLYPALLPSSISVEYSITIANGSSTLTLSIMLGVTLVFIPIVAGYQFWLHKDLHPQGHGEGTEPGRRVLASGAALQQQKRVTRWSPFVSLKHVVAI